MPRVRGDTKVGRVGILHFVGGGGIQKVCWGNGAFLPDTFG